MIKKWECNKIDEEKVNEFSKKNNVSRLLSKVMLSRGFTDDAEVQKFLHPKLDEISANILRNVPKENKKYVQKQLSKLDENFMDYIFYWNEKYYRNGFVDGVQLIGGCFEE